MAIYTIIVFGKIIMQMWIILVLSSTTLCLREHTFKKTAGDVLPRLENPQRLQLHTVSALTECGRLCSRSSSCIDLQYSSTRRACITGHTEDVSDGILSQSGLFDLYNWYFKDPETCFEIKRNNPTAKSGEYYIHPTAPQFQGVSVKVYCLMNDTHQLEYVTLPNRNFGHYPERSNGNCDEVEELYLTDAGVGMGGVTEYQKIRVQPSTMAVVRNDATFVSGSKTPPLDYGQAEDCYSYVVSCKKIGTFHINTLGTKMKVNTDLTWTAQVDSFKAHVESIAREENGAIIDIVCGGWCGGCSPKGDMLLYPNPQALDQYTDILPRQES